MQNTDQTTLGNSIEVSSMPWFKLNKSNQVFFHLTFHSIFHSAVPFHSTFRVLYPPIDYTVICSSGSSKIKGTASGIYPIPLRISGQYLYPSGSSSTSWGIYISPRKSRSLPGEYIYPPGSQLTSKSYLPLTPPYERRRGWLHKE